MSLCGTSECLYPQTQAAETQMHPQSLILQHPGHDAAGQKYGLPGTVFPGLFYPTIKASLVSVV